MRHLDDEALEQVARYFAALAVPMRLKILNALREGELNVSELTAATGCTQANASKHLALLTQHGLVRRGSRGTSVYYRIADPATYRLCDTVCGQLGRRFADHAGLGQMFSAAAGKSGKGKRRSLRAGSAARK
jgi:DNA-binding transcriptional ArsR family regulator